MTRPSYHPALKDAANRLVAAQNGACRACGATGELFGDHCHATGYLRGMICRSCNNLLARTGDSREVLVRRAEQAAGLIAYLDSGTTDVPYSRRRHGKISQPPNGAERIIAKFEKGPSWLANELETAPQTVGAWKARGKIPRWWHDAILKVAKKHKVEMSKADFNQ